ncbi:uncharacterized protein TRAVEDRAFT_29395 [Trametes versicolor FP-101664 SS1]|uniref:uncharacterized protein n=1 Tax=Trametes versicolor (strain FP-101664) TaxID=717944 RepID=UPI00046233D1|nr:uncharacterized protein TRAVEDRAFT_29395 [Trametes versicolor FP-101664 SS1]EIW57231.1 hypothetical protein TRAVEDRAFT_29395 [Trametes versicolor FP-101664 SS1]
MDVADVLARPRRSYRRNQETGIDGRGHPHREVDLQGLCGSIVPRVQVWKTTTPTSSSATKGGACSG